MAKKKKKAALKKSAVKKAVKKKAALKKSAVKKAVKKKAAPKTTRKKPAVARKPAARPAAVVEAPPVKKASATLGRPLVTNEEKLYLLFKEDYQAREVFDFLRVETVKDLEVFTPQEIVHILSKPIRQTVDGIRHRLAEKNRCLAGDEEYALKHREKLGDGS